MPPVDPARKRIVILTLGALAALGPFSIDMYLPSFPAISADLRTEISRVALSLASYFIGISFGQLAYGPLMDRLGRKPPLLAGLGLYIAASVGCALASSVEWLIALRFMLALGASAGIVASRATVRDLFPLSESAQVFSTIMLVMGVAPIIAPSLGGFASQAFGWRFIFNGLTLISAGLLAVVSVLLPESRGPDASVSLWPAGILGAYAGVLREPAFLAHAVVGGMSGAGMFAYISGSPFVYMQLFGLTPAQYGLAFGMNAACLITGSQVNRLALRRAGVPAVTRAVSSVQLGAALLLAGGTLFGLLGQTGTMILIPVYLFLHGFLNPNTTAQALAPFSRSAGSAAALQGSLQMGLSALASAAVSGLHNGTALPMTGVMAGCALVGASTLNAYRGLSRKRVLQSKSTTERVTP